MKKIFALLLAAFMLLTMMACGSANVANGAMADTTPTQTTVETSGTEPAAPSANAEPIVPDQVFDEQFWLEKCSENQGITMPVTSPEHCEEILHSLGFYEFHTGVRTSVGDEEIPLYPKELTIAGDSFKLLFDYKLQGMGSDTFYDMENFVLYGTKSDKADHIVRIPEENLVEEWVFDWNGEEVAQGNYFCHLIYYSAETNIDGASWATNTIRYYEDSHNLYNIVKVAPLQDPDKDATPRILVENKDALTNHLESNK